MQRIKLGVRLESFGLPLRHALTAAGKLGVHGIQVDAVDELSPKNLSETGRREFRHLLRLITWSCPQLAVRCGAAST